MLWDGGVRAGRSGLYPPSRAVPPRGPCPCRHFPFPTQPFRELQKLLFLFPCFGAWRGQSRSLRPPAMLEGTVGAHNPHRGRHPGVVNPPNGASPRGRDPRAARAELAAREGKMRPFLTGRQSSTGSGGDAWALQLGDLQLLQRDPEGTGGRGGGDLEGEAWVGGGATHPISYVSGDTSRNGSCHRIRPRVDGGGVLGWGGVCGGVCVSLGSPHPPLLLPGDPQRTLTHFSQANVSHYDIFLLHESEEELYVGARDRVLALAVGTPGSIRAKASVSSSRFRGGWLRGGAFCRASVSPLGLGGRGLAQQLWTMPLPSADNVGTHG